MMSSGVALEMELRMLLAVDAVALAAWPSRLPCC